MKKRIAIISPDVMGPIHNGGVGTSCALLAELLASDGYDVDLVFALEDRLTVKADKKWTAFYKKRGVHFKMLPLYDFELQHGHLWVRISYAVFEYMKTQSYDLVIFPDMFGTGYFTQVARANGQMFQNTNFLVSFLGPQVWSKEDNLQLFATSKDISIPMLEHGTVALADCVQFATKWSVEWAAKHGWKTADSDLVLFPFAKVENPAPPRKSVPKEIVFFGRLEYRKGLCDFLEALEELNRTGDLKDRQITLLGRAGQILGTPGDLYVRDWAKRTGIKLTMLLDLQSYEAIAYLKKRNALAVVPSHSETMGYTVIECLSHGIPVICTDIEPFLEILGPLGTKGTFKPRHPKSMADTIRSQEFILGVKRARELYEKTQSQWLRLVAKMVHPKPVQPKSTQSVSISVLMPYHERPDFLREALESLLRQTEQPQEILIYDDCSQTDAGKKVVESLRKSFEAKNVAIKLFRGEENKGPCFARNFLATKAKSEFILFMDDDNRALPGEIESFRKIQRYNDADVVTTAMKKFFDGQEDLWLDRRWTPVGFSVPASVLENLMGDTNMLIRRSVFEKIGGFPDAKDLRAEDLHLLVRAAHAGAKMALSPEPLFEYRIHKSNRSRLLDYHASRLLNIKNALPSKSNDMTPLHHLILALSYNHGLVWIDEPPPTEKPLSSIPKAGVDLMPKFPQLVKGATVERFGIGYKMDIGKDGQVEIAIPKDRRLKSDRQNYLILLLVAEKSGEVLPSNGFQTLRVPDGKCGLTIGLEDREKIKLKFKMPGQRVYVSHAWVVPEKIQ